MTRCRNCGDADHKTNKCLVFGPWFPDPSKEPGFYDKEKERIAALVAGDILAEHEEGHEHGEGTDGAPAAPGAGAQGLGPEAGGEVRGPGGSDGEVEPGRPG